MRRRGRPPHDDILTPREWQVLELLREDLTNEQIADRLGVTHNTVKYHVSEIYGKLGVSGRLEAASWQPEVAGRRRWFGFLPAWLAGPSLATATRAGAVLVIGGAVVGFGLLLAGVLVSGRGAESPFPGAGKIAYLIGGDVWVKHLPDGQPQRLTHDGANMRPVWSPSGEWLSFWRNVPGDGTVTYVMREDGSEERRIDGIAYWSPVEDRLAFLAGGSHPGGGSPLVVESPDGVFHRELVPPVSLRDALRSGAQSPHVWSPDGRYLTYGEHLRATPGAGGDSSTGFTAFVVRAVAVDGGDPEEIYRDETVASVYVGGWTADNQYLLLLTRPAESGGLRAIVATTGDTPRELVDVPNVVAALDPAGEVFALAEGVGVGWENKRIVLYQPHTGTLTPLTDPAMAAIAPAWSPDGERLAFIAAPDAPEGLDLESAAPYMAERRLWVMDRDGTNQRRLTDDPRYRDESPQWSADGRYILFGRVDLQAEAPSTSVWLLDVKSGDLTQLVDGLEPWEALGFNWLKQQQLSYWP